MRRTNQIETSFLDWSKQGWEGKGDRFKGRTRIGLSRGKRANWIEKSLSGWPEVGRGKGPD